MRGFWRDPQSAAFTGTGGRERNDTLNVKEDADLTGMRPEIDGEGVSRSQTR
jgi:hypothetical protein